MKIIIIMAMAIISFTACDRNKAVKTNEGASQTYACPMKCEGTTVYREPGKCPVCGMDLEPVNDNGSGVSYEMKLTRLSEDPEAGKPARLSFIPKVKGNDTLQVPLDEVHEKKMHIVIVSQDLGWYDHIHPEYQADGSYMVTETFPAGGEYIVFADYQPTGGGNQVERIIIPVSGMVKKRETFTSENLTSETDGYLVTLKPEAGKLLTNNMNHLGVEVTEKGVPVTSFENIMGAKGHLVIISGDGQKYIHVHPDEVEGKLDLHTQFEQPGIYRAFFQFQTKGKLHTSYFTIDVKEGKPGEISIPEGHHDHQQN